jgi:hypothetical protein
MEQCSQIHVERNRLRGRKLIARQHVVVDVLRVRAKAVELQPSLSSLLPAKHPPYLIFSQRPLVFYPY